MIRDSRSLLQTVFVRKDALQIDARNLADVIVQSTCSIGRFHSWDTLSQRHRREFRSIPVEVTPGSWTWSPAPFEKNHSPDYQDGGRIFLDDEEYIDALDDSLNIGTVLSSYFSQTDGTLDHPDQFFSCMEAYRKDFLALVTHNSLVGTAIRGHGNSDPLLVVPNDVLIELPSADGRPLLLTLLRGTDARGYPVKA